MPEATNPKGFHPWQRFYVSYRARCSFTRSGVGSSSSESTSVLISLLRLAHASKDGNRALPSLLFSHATPLRDHHPIIRCLRRPRL